MKHVKQYIQSNLFLNTHNGVNDFIHLFLKDMVNQNWTVICERSSDINVLKQYIFKTIQTKSNQDISSIGGLSFYSLDQVGQSICALLAAQKNHTKIQQLPSSLFKFYLPQKTQEKIIQFILNLFHLPAQDTLPIAKQILVLLDTPLPQDVTLINALFDALNLKKKRSYKDIPTTLLKQILASYQSSKIVLDRYARLQTLVNEFLQTNFLEIVEENANLAKLIIPQKIIDGSILWMSAPEYISASDNQKTDRFGDYPQTLLQDIFQIIANARKHLNTKENSYFFHNQTILKTDISDQEIESSKKFEFYLFNNPYEFYQNVQKQIDEQCDTVVAFLGEFDPNAYQTILQNASGAYALNEKEIQAWKNKDYDNFFFKNISNQIFNKYTDFIETASYIENFSKLREIANVYSIPIYEISDEQLESLFEASIKNENYIYQKNDTFKLPNAFQFFDTQQTPISLKSFWSKIHYEPSSLTTRLLNQVFAFFQTEGVQIINPCGDTEYNYFWKHIAYLSKEFPNLNLQFYIENIEIIDKFPIRLNKKQCIPIQNSKTPSSILANEIYVSHLLDSNIQKLKILFDKIDFKSISTTQFERFVECPFQFFLDNCAEIKPNQEKKNFEVEPMELGTRVHKICETLVSEMVLNYGNDGYLNHALPFFEKLMLSLSPEEIFISPSKNTWINTINNFSDFEKGLLNKIFDQIFISDSPSHENSSVNLVILEEMLKRTFLKFLKTEVEILKQENKQRIGTAREFPFSIALGNLTIRGCIDRVDLNKDGYEIIDYKVSPISKSIKNLSLLPSEFFAHKNNNKLSIQGAVYSLAFGQNAFGNQESYETNDNENRLSGFSLYRLKNIKDDAALLTYKFDNSESKTSGYHQIKLIEKELLHYANNLLNKNFFPNPLNQKQTCQYCSYKNLCPFPTQQGYQI